MQLFPHQTDFYKWKRKSKWAYSTLPSYLERLGRTSSLNNDHNPQNPVNLRRGKPNFNGSRSQQLLYSQGISIKHCEFTSEFRELYMRGYYSIISSQLSHCFICNHWDHANYTYPNSEWNQQLLFDKPSVALGEHQLSKALLLFFRFRSLHETISKSLWYIFDLMEPSKIALSR